MRRCAPDLTPLRVGLLTKFHGFFKSLLESPSPEVSVVARLVARDIRTSLGSTLALIRRETGLDPWRVGRGHLCQVLKEKAKVNVPESHPASKAAVRAPKGPLLW